MMDAVFRGHVFSHDSGICSVALIQQWVWVRMALAHRFVRIQIP